MLTEKELRTRLNELDKFWDENNKSRVQRKVGGAWPADYFWYIYTREAYLEILELRANDEKWES